MSQKTNSRIDQLRQEIDMLNQLFIDRFTAGASGAELVPLRNTILTLEQQLKRQQQEEENGAKN